MALKTSNKNRKKVEVIVIDPCVSSEFKKVFEVDVDDTPIEEVKEFLDAAIINYRVTEVDHPELYKQMRKQNDDISIVIFWISVIAVSIIGLLL